MPSPASAFVSDSIPSFPVKGPYDAHTTAQTGGVIMLPLAKTRFQCSMVRVVERLGV